MDGTRISNVTYCKLNKILKTLHFFERKKKVSKLIKGGVGIKISRVEKFRKINNRGGDDYSEPQSNRFWRLCIIAQFYQKQFSPQSLYANAKKQQVHQFVLCLARLKRGFNSSLAKEKPSQMQLQLHSVYENLDLKGNIMHVPFLSLIIG